MSRPILIVRTGTTLPGLRRDFGDFHDWIAARLYTPALVLHLDAREGGALPPPGDYDGIVVTGSHAMVSERTDWSERLAGWLSNVIADRTPLLGICFGHQLLAHALGGDVGYRPQGREVGTVEAMLTADGRYDRLFSAMPPKFLCQMAHEQSVLTLPPGAVCLASSAAEPHQAFRIGSHAWGVQFHPEFSAAVTQGYRAHMEGNAGGDPILETPDCAGLLARFAAIASEATA